MKALTTATVAVICAACGDSGGTTPQVDEAPTVAVVRAFMDSALLGDAEALEQTVAPDVVYTWLWRDELVISPITGADVPRYFLDIQHRLDPAPGFESLGEPVAIGEFQVVVANHMGLNSYDGVMLYTLKRHDGDLKITEIYWIPERTASGTVGDSPA